MRSFSDTTGTEWIASAIEEETTRHHGRWFLTFRPAESGSDIEYVLSEVRWQNRQTAERTILTMSEAELRRRLRIARARGPRPVLAESLAATR